MPSRPASVLQRRVAALIDESPTIPLDFASLEAAAAVELPTEVFDYVAGGAGTEGTMRANRTAFDRYQILPHVLEDVSTLDLSTTLFGRPVAAPVVLAPIGRQSQVHAEGELASAAAAAELDVPFALSTAATRDIESVADANKSGERFFQLYWPTADTVAKSLVKRAETAGYNAILVTVDSQIPKWRPRTLTNGYGPKQDARYANFESDPVVQALASDAGTCVTEYVESNPNPLSKDRALTWDTLGRIRDWTSLPVVLKGIRTERDARQAAYWGADGIVVSNHGGRVIDGEGAALDHLPCVVDAVGDDLTVLFDSGIRSGADIFTALALGADAIMVGRPYIYALAIAGQPGVVELIENYLAELESVMGLGGRSTITNIDRKAVRAIRSRESH